ncbi:hypothetical protein CLU79DRAFT_696829 [Phycomyces nitens]|nr:hypothetical protein CLU79DRAFT_696829 [Phycomyces nitens]
MTNLRRNYNNSLEKKQKLHRNTHQHRQHQNQGIPEHLPKGEQDDCIVLDLADDATAYGPEHRTETTIYEKKKQVIIVLGQSLLKTGCPSHRVEDVLLNTARLMEIDATFSFLPDSIILTFKHSTNGTTESIMAKSPTGFDTNKICQINAIMNDFQNNRCEIEECLSALQKVAAAPSTWGVIGTLFCFGVSSFTASAVMFNGSWIDASLSCGLGCLVASLSVIAGYFPAYSRVFDISASILVAIITRAMHSYVCFTSVAVSSILILLPGYAMTMSILEISARHITTGTTRLVYAVVYAFMLAYGLQIGSSVYTAIDPNASDKGTCINPISQWFYIPLFPIMSVSIAMSFGSSYRQWPTQTFCAAIGFCISYFIGQVVPDGQIVGSLAAFCVGLYSNLALKITGDAPLVPLCVGVTLLVPGSIGVKGAYALLHQNDITKSLFPLHMMTIALGLSVGLFAAAMIVYPTGKNRSMYISL